MKQQPRTISQEESEQLLGFYCRSAKSDHQKFQFARNRLIMMIMLDAGLRVSEVANLTLGLIVAYDQISKSVTISKAIAKKQHARVIPLSERLQNELLLYSCWWGPFTLRASNQPVFPKSPGGEALTQRQIQRIVGVASRGSFGRRISPHVLRHTFATKMIKVTNLRIVQQLLGHVNLQTTQIYTHPDHQDLTDAINKLGTNGEA